MSGRYPEAIAALLTPENPHAKPGFNQVIEAVRDFDQSDWQNWLRDRLQGRDKFWPPHHYFDEQPDYLFRDLIPKLKEKPEHAQLLTAFGNAVAACLNEVDNAEHGWELGSTNRLIILAGSLELVNTADMLIQLLDRSELIKHCKPDDFQEYSDDPRFQLLSALSRLCGQDKTIRQLPWIDYASQCKARYAAACFYGAWKQRQWGDFGKIIEGLSDDFLPATDLLGMELYNLLGETPFNGSLWKKLQYLAEENGFFRNKLISALQDNEGCQKWPNNLKESLYEKIMRWLIRPPNQPQSCSQDNSLFGMGNKGNTA